MEGYILCDSAVQPDWRRERKAAGEWNPGKSLLATIRDYQAAKSGWLGFLPRKVAVVRHRFWSAVSGADIPLNTRIGGGLLIPHPNGIVIHPDVTMGNNCLIFQQVTLGTRRDGVPVIGSHVDIGAGAKILGGVTIGDRALIGANAVVLSNVPADCSAIGIPAVVQSDFC